MVLKHHVYVVVVFKYLQKPHDAYALLERPVHPDLIHEELNPILDAEYFLFEELFDGNLWRSLQFLFDDERSWRLDVVGVCLAQEILDVI